MYDLPRGIMFTNLSVNWKFTLFQKVCIFYEEWHDLKFLLPERGIAFYLGHIAWGKHIQSLCYRFPVTLGNSSCLSTVHSFIYKIAMRVSPRITVCFTHLHFGAGRGGTSLCFSPRLKKMRPYSWLRLLDTAMLYCKNIIITVLTKPLI